MAFTAPIALSGGLAKCDFFGISATTSMQSIWQGLSQSAIATTNAQKAFSATELVGVTPDYQDDGTVKISFENYEDTEGLNDFLNAYAVPAVTASGAKPDYKLENGTLRTQASVSGKQVLAIYYGSQTGSEAGTAGAKTKMCIAVGSLSPTSGSYSSKADDWNKPKLEFVGTKVPRDIAIAAGLFDSNIVTTSLQTIAANSGFLRTFMLNKG